MDAGGAHPGHPFGTFFVAAHSAQGPRLGLPQMIQSRPQFGYVGALLVWVFALATYVGFNGFCEVIGGQILQATVGLPSVPAGVAVAVVAVLVAITGYRLIHRAQRWLTAALLATFFAVTVAVVAAVPVPAEQLAPSGFAAVPFLAQFGASTGYQLSWAIYVSDYSRYLPADIGNRSSFWWTYTGAFLGSWWPMSLGAWGVIATGLPDPIAAMIQAGNSVVPGLGLITVLISLLGLMTITALNFYGGSLTLISIIVTLRSLRPTRRLRVSALAVLLVTNVGLALLTGADLVASFSVFLTWLLYVLTPWTSINLVDFYAVRHGRYSVREIFNPAGIYGRASWRGLVSYAIGFAAMVPFFSVSSYAGPAARALGGADIAVFVGLLVSGACYWLACRSLDLQREHQILAHIDAELEIARHD
ncbi:purine-cytosine permease family protein [Saccharopolyspora sp. 5N102]|uniref:purine-cytosine permease family protein n=1 Tax=Saccharopolyspora sp. 5N102 TaxID=3375155 RepID=UPI003791BDC1